MSLRHSISILMVSKLRRIVLYLCTRADHPPGRMLCLGGNIVMKISCQITRANYLPMRNYGVSPTDKDIYNPCSFDIYRS